MMVMENLSWFDVPGGDNHPSLSFHLTHCPWKALLVIRVAVIRMTMKAMMMKTMMMKMMIMKTLMMKTVMMADQQQDSLSAAKAVPEELQVQVRASFLAREKPWIEKSEKTKVIQCFNSRLQ